MKTGHVLTSVVSLVYIYSLVKAHKSASEDGRVIGLGALSSLQISISCLPGGLNEPNQDPSERFKPCLTDDNCPRYAFCRNETTCVCEDHYVQLRLNKTYFECHRVAKGYEDRCHFDEQCMKPLGSLAICVHKAPVGEGTCTCKYGSHFKDGVCWRTSRIKNRCDSHNNCLISNPQLKAYCFERYCICPPGYYGVNNGTDCIMKTRLNGECNTDEACKDMNAICSGICLCKNDYVLSNEQDRCLKAAGRIGDECIEHSQCSQYLNYSICEDLKGVCVCNKTVSYEFGGRCYKKVAFHGVCREREECLVSLRNTENVDCIGGICACSDGFLYENSKCVPENVGLGQGSSITSALWIFQVIFFALIKKF